jgi:hypothetical protein
MALLLELQDLALKDDRSVLATPVLANCANRATLPRTNPNYGEPDSWFQANCLSSTGYISLSFDFFVDWSSRAVAFPPVRDTIWVKRIATSPIVGLPNAQQLSTLQNQAQATGVDLAAMSAFAACYGLHAKLAVIYDNVKWATNPSDLLFIGIEQGVLVSPQLLPLSTVMSQIQSLTGRAWSVGSKGLFYGTSALECFLSTSGAAWPGDCDSVLWDSARGRAKCLIEFKKHTPSGAPGPAARQTVATYFQTDRPKWARLLSLAAHLGCPLHAVIYPTDPADQTIKIEEVGVCSGAFTVVNSAVHSTRGMSACQVGQLICANL